MQKHQARTQQKKYIGNRLIKASNCLKITVEGLLILFCLLELSSESDTMTEYMRAPHYLVKPWETCVKMVFKR